MWKVELYGQISKSNFQIPKFVRPRPYDDPA